MIAILRDKEIILSKWQSFVDFFYNHDVNLCKVVLDCISLKEPVLASLSASSLPLMLQ